MDCGLGPNSYTMRELTWWFLASTHILAAAVWFGAMVYNLTIMHPGAKRFFHNDIEKFEEFIATISQGARWKVITGIGLVAASGAGLIPLAHPANQAHWNALIAAKAILLLIAVIVFWYASWRLWPKRIFAVGAEAERIQRQFRIVAISMICIAAAAMVLGVLARVS
jgi:uncharacterized membrane protein